MKKHKTHKKKSWLKVLVWCVVGVVVIGGATFGIYKLVKHIDNKKDTSQSEEKKENQEVQATRENEIANRIVAGI